MQIFKKFFSNKSIKKRYKNRKLESETEGIVEEMKSKANQLGNAHGNFNKPPADATNAISYIGEVYALANKAISTVRKYLQTSLSEYDTVKEDKKMAEVYNGELAIERAPFPHSINLKKNDVNFAAQSARTARKKNRRWNYFILPLIALGLCAEVILVASGMARSLVIGRVEAWILAFGIGASLLILIHFLPAVFSSKKSSPLAKVTLTISIVGIIVAAVILITYFRSQAFEGIISEKEAYSLLILNLLFICSSVVASYKYQPKDHELVLLDEHSSLKSDLNDLKKQDRKIIKQMAVNSQNIKGKLQFVRDLVRYGQDMEDSIKSEFNSAFYKYVSVNNHVRDPQFGTPKFFDQKPPQLEFYFKNINPKTLENLEI